MSIFKLGFGQFCYTLIFIGMVYMGVRLQEYFKLLAGRTAQPLPHMIYIVIFSIAIGIFIGLPSLILKSEKEIWKIDWVRLVAMGLPTLFMSTLLFTYWITPLRFLALTSLFDNTTFFIANGIMFGYTLISSVKKDSKVNRNDVEQI